MVYEYKEGVLYEHMCPSIGGKLTSNEQILLLIQEEEDNEPEAI